MKKSQESVLYSESRSRTRNLCNIEANSCYGITQLVRVEVVLRLAKRPSELLLDLCRFSLCSFNTRNKLFGIANTPQFVSQSPCIVYSKWIIKQTSRILCLLIHSCSSLVVHEVTTISLYLSLFCGASLRVSFSSLTLTDLVSWFPLSKAWRQGYERDSFSVPGHLNLWPLRISGSEVNPFSPAPSSFQDEK